jgi:hypothetical protein
MNLTPRRAATSTAQHIREFGLGSGFRLDGGKFRFRVEALTIHPWRRKRNTMVGVIGESRGGGGGKGRGMKLGQAGQARLRASGFGLRAAGYVLWVSSVGLKASGLGRGVSVRR